MFLNKPNPSTYVISSPLEGVLLRDGKPLGGAKIIRKLRWNGNAEGIFQEFMTDPSGAFSLPVHEETLTLGVLEQFVGKTDLEVEVDGNMEFFWYSAKMHKDLDSKVNEVPENLICDIEEAEKSVNVEFGTCLTKCRWSNMPKDIDPDDL